MKRINICKHIGRFIGINISRGGQPEPLPQLDTPDMTVGELYTDSVALEWDAVDGATSYVLQRRIGGLWAVLYSGPNLTYTDDTLAPATTYQYRLKAIGDGYRDSAYSHTEVTTAGVAEGFPYTFPLTFS